MNDRSEEATDCLLLS